MTDLPRYPHEDTEVVSNPEPAPGRSPWVYVFWVVVIALVIAIVALHLTGTIEMHGH